MKKTIKSDFSRKCPICNIDLFYSTKVNLTSAIKKNKLCRQCSFEKNRNYNGDKNPFYGKKHTEASKQKIKKTDKSYTQTVHFKEEASKASSHRKDFRGYYEIWKEKYGIEIANEKLLETKKKQSINTTGSNNPMFGKPPTKGVGSGWAGWYNSFYFRSLLELSYIIDVLEENNCNWQSAEKKELGMPYTDWSGKNKTYFADFLIDGYSLIEIKPIRLRNTPRVLTKKMAAQDFCTKNNFSYELITPQYMDKNKLMSLYKNGLVKFSSKSEKHFLKYYGLL
jgi:hypothetical protein